MQGLCILGVGEVSCLERCHVLIARAQCSLKKTAESFSVETVNDSHHAQCSGLYVRLSDRSSKGHIRGGGYSEEGSRGWSEQGLLPGQTHYSLSLTVIHQSQPEKPMALGLSVHNTRLKGQTEEGYSHRVETSYQLPNGV